MRQLIQRVRRDPMLDELVRSSSVLYVAGVVSVGLLLLQQATTARYLGATDFGRLATALGFVMIASLVVDIRSWELGTRLLAAPLDRHDVDEATVTYTWILRTELLAGLLGAVVAVAAAPAVAEIALDGSDAGLVVVLAPMVLLRQVSLGVGAATLRMLDRFPWLAWRSMANAVIRLVLVAGAAFLGWSVYSVAAGLVLSEIVAAVSIVLLADRAFRARHGRGLLTRTRLEERSGPRQLVRSLWASATIKSLHVESFLPVAAAFTSSAQIGVLRTGLDVGQLTQQATAPVTMVMSPRLVLLAGKGHTGKDGSSADVQLLDRYLHRVRRVLLVLSVAAALIGAVVVVAILPTYVGPGFEDLEIVGLLVVSGLAVSAATQWVRPVLVGLDRVGAQNRLGIVTGLASIAALPWVVSEHGAVGAAADMLVFLVVYATLSARLATKAVRDASA